MMHVRCRNGLVPGLELLVLLKLIRALALLFVALVAAAAVAVFYAQHTRLDARAQPSRLEAEIARRLRSLAIPDEQRHRTNPVRNTPEAVRAGMEHFADHCSICHANDGTGNTAFGRGLYPKPPDLRSARTQALPDGEIFAIIEDGVRFTGMPGFGAADEHGDEDTWKLVLFIRHLPSITPDELTHMKALNPQGRSGLRTGERTVVGVENGKEPLKGSEVRVGGK